MRAGVLRAPGRVEVMEVEEPKAADDEILVEMRAVGICGSDLAAFAGRHPFRRPPVVLGHEGAGRVVRAPASAPFEVGDRVAIMPLLSCWNCDRCESGVPHLCASKRVPGSGWEGMLGEYAVAPSRVLFRLADQLSYAEGAMMEPVAVGWHAARVGGIAPGDSVAILGAGTIGGLIACVCELLGVSTLMVTDVRTARLTLVEGLVGCHTVDAGCEDVVAVGRALSAGRGFDVVVVASGHPSCLDEALGLCRPRGTVVVLPMFGASISADLNPVVLGETVVRGSTTYTPADFRTAAEVITTRRLDVRPFLSEPVGLSRTQALFEELASGSHPLKAQVDPARF